MDQEKLGSLNVLGYFLSIGIRGYIVYRFRGRYYILYRPCGSYLEGLDVWIVKFILQDSKEYQRNRLNENCR